MIFLSIVTLLVWTSHFLLVIGFPLSSLFTIVLSTVKDLVSAFLVSTKGVFTFFSILTFVNSTSQALFLITFPSLSFLGTVFSTVKDLTTSLVSFLAFFSAFLASSFGLASSFDNVSGSSGVV